MNFPSVIAAALLAFAVPAMAGDGGLPTPFSDPVVSAGATSSTSVHALVNVDSCYVAQLPGTIQVEGNVVTWIVEVLALACGTPPPPYPIETSFGPLAPGSYTLLVRTRDPSSGALGPAVSVGFVVANGTIPTLDAKGLLVFALLVGFVAAARFKKEIPKRVTARH